MKVVLKKIIKGVKKLLHIINFPRHIKHYYLHWRILTATLVLAGGVGLWIFIKKTQELKEENKCRKIGEVILKDGEGRNVRKWDIHNYISCLIGKNTEQNRVDIDLSAATYSSLISREHAVMNNTGDEWYFEDIGSSNGSRIRKKHTGEKFKVKPGKPYQINSGDILYIANTKLLVK